jgi:hypothetical protein
MGAARLWLWEPFDPALVDALAVCLRPPADPSPPTWGRMPSLMARRPWAGWSSWTQASARPGAGGPGGGQEAAFRAWVAEVAVELLRPQARPLAFISTIYIYIYNVCMHHI